MTSVKISAPAEKKCVRFIDLDVGDFFIFPQVSNIERLFVKVSHREYLMLGGVEKGVNLVQHDAMTVLLVEHATISYK